MQGSRNLPLHMQNFCSFFFCLSPFSLSSGSCCVVRRIVLMILHYMSVIILGILFPQRKYPIDAQWEGMGDVGSARYELALLPPCPTIRVLSYMGFHGPNMGYFCWGCFSRIHTHSAMFSGHSFLLTCTNLVLLWDKSIGLGGTIYTLESYLCARYLQNHLMRFKMLYIRSSSHPPPPPLSSFFVPCFLISSFPVLASFLFLFSIIFPIFQLWLKCYYAI